METLPEEVKVQILSLLSLPDLCQIARVSSYWHELALDHSLWRRIPTNSNTNDNDLCKIINKHPYITHFYHDQNSFVTEAGLSRVFVQCGKTLTNISLARCDVLSSDLISIMVEFCVAMTYLNISSNYCVDDVTLCQLATCQNLTSLDIANCERVTDGGMEMLVSQRPLTKLNAGNLLDVRVRTIESLILFCAQSLQNLLLDGGNLQDEDVAKLGQLPQLRMLEIQYCDEITDVGITPLSKLAHLSTLRLYRTFNLTSYSVSRLATNLSSLSTLLLSDCSEIDDRGLVSLGRYSPQLECLELAQSYCHTLTDVGLGAVVLGCPRLHTLVLKGLKGVRSFICLIPALRKRRLTHLHLGGCQNIPVSLLETVAAFCPRISIFGHYANRVKRSEFIKNCIDPPEVEVKKEGDMKE